MESHKFEGGHQQVRASVAHVQEGGVERVYQFEIERGVLFNLGVRVELRDHFFLD